MGVIPPVSPMPGQVQPHQVGRRAAWWIGGAAAVAFALTMLAVFDVRLWHGPALQYLVAFLLVTLSNAAVGAIVATAVIVREDRFRFPPWLPIRTVHRVLLLVGGTLVLGMTILIDLWITDEAPDELGAVPTSWVVFLGVGILTMTGAMSMTLAADPSRLGADGTSWVLRAVQVAFGVGVGLVMAFAPVVGTSVLRYRREVAVPEAPIVGDDPDDPVIDTYVALGDSYSAGEGLKEYEEGTGGLDPATGHTNCHRSDAQAYPEVIPFEPEPEMTFVACSGAITVDVETGYDDPPDTDATDTVTIPHVSVPPQVPADPPVDPSVDLVTMTMGGNDLLFSEVVKHCLAKDDCTNATFEPDFPWKHTEGIYPGDEKHVAGTPGGVVNGDHLDLGDWAETMEVRLASTLGTTYGHLRTHYPNARIVVLGYPYLFPEGSAGFTLSDCDTVLRMVSEKERRVLHDLQNGFNDTLYRTALAANVEFVSPEAIWAGHEPCGGLGQYTNAVKPIFGESGSFHPNREGQQAYAALLACYLESTEQPRGANRPVRLRWERSVRPAAPAPGSAERPVICDGG